MRVYLDMCCLKRPFDDRSQSRILLESEAILALMEAHADQIEMVRGSAQDLENEQNPLPDRASKVRQWLEELPAADLVEDSLQRRTEQLIALGFKNFDAFHLACAELGGADVLCTCDDRLIAVARRNAAQLKARVANPVDLVREVFP